MFINVGYILCMYCVYGVYIVYILCVYAVSVQLRIYMQQLRVTTPINVTSARSVELASARGRHWARRACYRGDTATAAEAKL